MLVTQNLCKSEDGFLETTTTQLKSWFFQTFIRTTFQCFFLANCWNGLFSSYCSIKYLSDNVSKYRSYYLVLLLLFYIKLIIRRESSSILHCASDQYRKDLQQINDSEDVNVDGMWYLNVNWWLILGQLICDRWCEKERSCYCEICLQPCNCIGGGFSNASVRWTPDHRRLYHPIIIQF